MSKTAMIRARTEPDLKKSVDSILEKLGLNESEAINIFFRQIKLHNGIPFEVKLPNKITQKTFKDTDNDVNVIKFKSQKELFNSLGV